MLGDETHTYIALQSITGVERTRTVAATRFGNVDTFLFAVSPRVKAAVLNDGLQVVAVSEMIQLCYALLFYDGLICLPIALLFHCSSCFVKQQKLPGRNFLVISCLLKFEVIKRIETFCVSLYEVGMRERFCLIVHIAAGIVVQQDNRFCFACLA